MYVCIYEYRSSVFVALHPKSQPLGHSTACRSCAETATAGLILSVLLVSNVFRASHWAARSRWLLARPGDSIEAVHVLMSGLATLFAVANTIVHCRRVVWGSVDLREMNRFFLEKKVGCLVDDSPGPFCLIYASGSLGATPRDRLPADDIVAHDFVRVRSCCLFNINLRFAALGDSKS